MSNGTDFAASLIEAGSGGYASAAAGKLVEQHPETAARFGDGAFRRWKEHFVVRLRELAAALLVSEPDLFVADVEWSRESFAAREVPVEDLRASLGCLGEVLAEELPEGSREEPIRYLEAAISALDQPSAPADPVSDGGPQHEELALHYLEAALSGDGRRAIDTVLAAVDDGLAIADAYEHVLTSAQGRVGEMWHRWEVSVAQEHYVTATTQSLMTLLARKAEPLPAKNKTVVVSVVPGNGHDLAPRALADSFERAGWRAIPLGGGLPAAELAIGLEAFEADVLALSMALSTQVRGAIETVRRARGARPGIKILLGGRVVARTPGLWRKLGVDAQALGYEEAVRVAEELVG